MENFLEPSQPIQISSLLDRRLLERYDIFLFDAYGVFWDGSKLIKATADDMAELVKQGKQVCVVSNTTQLSKDAIVSYERRKLEQGVHYHEFTTSGDVFKNAILDGSLQQKIIKTRHETKQEGRTKVYIFGNPRKELFKDSNFDIVEELKEADCVYLSIPQFTTEEKDAILKEHPEYKLYFKKSNLTKSGEPERWDVIEGHQEVFYPYLDGFISLGLPILNANPDHSSPEREKDTDPIVVNSVVRNGTLTEYIKNHSGVVFEFGKPNTEIFEFALKKVTENWKKLKELEKQLNDKVVESTLTLDKKEQYKLIKEARKIESKINIRKKALMIGDTRKTDIKGAKDFGISSGLVSTGNEAKTELNGKDSRATYYLNR